MYRLTSFTGTSFTARALVTGTSTEKFDISSQVGLPQGLVGNADFSKVYIQSKYNSRNIFQYTLPGFVAP